ncbi:alpha-2-macroglobulin family protein [Tropicimonas marinistellae]|uniref:alpha-2-macroglobulin family protein n=1 Tax=Tropicimonas marinistellae TaxID=1739787 RepID=UPI000830AD25|nr:alpha-2-macroglobulin family protein [Tropicimonas marinistellae]
MRRILTPVLILAAAIIHPISTAAQPAEDTIPQRRVIVERDMDYYGADLRALFDTTYEACRNACLNDAACTAFTFNGRSNSCFPKREMIRREPYEGALSAIVVNRPPGVMERARLRAAELPFIQSGDLEFARAEAEELPRRHIVGGWTVEALEAAVREAQDRGDAAAAMRWAGGAVVLTDRPDHWLDYARHALQATGGDRSQTRRLRARALPATINAYLRAAAPTLRGEILQTMAEALEAANRGPAAIPALRLAESVAPNPRVSAALDRAIGAYGFRIVDHEVHSDIAAPEFCVTFSEALDEGTDYAPYLRVPGESLSVEADGRQICVGGLEHGRRYSASFRAGLPSTSGERMLRDVSLNIYVRDRAPSARFPGRAFVLPRVPDAALPIVTVNLSEVELTLRRVSDRNLIQMIQDNLFGQPLSEWEDRRFADSLAEEVWSGTGEVASALNKDVTTLLPMTDAVDGLPPGLYVLRAAVPGTEAHELAPATQWFVISDIGLSSMSGVDGLHVFARGLGSAEPLAGAEASLVSRSNRVLAVAEMDDQGYAHFAPGLMTGHGGASPALVVVRRGTEDMAFLPLTDPEFDLSDRGVEGRPAAGPIDVFLATDRGAYRAGETVHATVLARDGNARAIDMLPLTAVLTRPDGVEYSRVVSDGGRVGGHVFSLSVGATVPRGTWRLAIHADPEMPALASQTVLVEDFLPERIDVNLQLPDTEFGLMDSPLLQVSATYLFGAPGGDLPVEGEVQLRAADGIRGFPGFRFGLHDAPFSPHMAVLAAARTNDVGEAEFPVEFPQVDAPNGPLEAHVTVRVAEGSGRPVERRLVRALAPAAPLVGIRPAFDGVVPEGTEAIFDLIAVGTSGAAMPMRVSWKLNRIETRYQWFSQYGNWDWEPVTRRSPVASGEAMLGVDPVRVAAPVDWGRYELVVERSDGPYVASSVDFHAGWFAPADASSTPDMLEVSLDKPAYLPGETAYLRVVPRQAGKALVTVVSNRLIAMKTLELPAGETVVDLPVTDDWGAGAYVTASFFRPLDGDADVPAARGPVRALGLAHAAIDPGAARLNATFDVPSTAPPRAPLDVALRVEGIAPGTEAFATIAAVDQGILNLTGHQPPDASGYYFGQRKLGMGLRDLYGRLIDGRTGVRGRIRSGGDAMAEMRMQSPPPTEDLVAFFSGPVEVGTDGYARARFNLPAFNGQVKLMAVVWSADAVGEASADVLVRDPVVLTASLPRFLAPGDDSRLLVEFTQAEGATGTTHLSLAADGIVLDTSAVPAEISLSEGATERLAVPMQAEASGVATIDIALVTPGGDRLEKNLTLPIVVNDPESARTSRFSLAPGARFSLSTDVFAGFVPGTGSATLAIGPLGRFDAPGLLRALDRYPYGCTEQVTSQALPLLYFDHVSRAMGLGNGETVTERIGQAVDTVLSRQSTSGGFGLWHPGEDDFWLDAYVTDFLARVRTHGHTVPERAFSQALDNLRNKLNYAPDFETGGEDVAYALFVLAREGAVPVGDLRYYADVKGRAFATPLAMAQLGAALALYGDQTRADRMFAFAADQLLSSMQDEATPLWRADYGTNLRDRAGVLALASEAGTMAVDRELLSQTVTSIGRPRSTQEAAWSLLAAHALIESDSADFLIDGQPASGPLVRMLEDSTAVAPVVVTNASNRTAELTLTTFGVPIQPELRGGNGYAIERAYFTMDGVPASPEQVPLGTRLVSVLTVTPFDMVEARLMVVDPLPAGFEIDNPSLVRGGDIRQLPWLETADTRTAEFRADRFLAAVDWRSGEPFRLAYIVRAITPGSYHHPAASVEDMYRPQFRGRSDSGRVMVVP